MELHPSNQAFQCHSCSTPRCTMSEISDDTRIWLRATHKSSINQGLELRVQQVVRLPAKRGDGLSCQAGFDAQIFVTRRSNTVSTARTGHTASATMLSAI